METASIRDSHNRPYELVRKVAQGEVIYIQRRGETVAQLRPAPKRPMPDMTEIWARCPQVPGDSGRFLEEDRDRP
jgi:antitoxin (DNA-binding transcriptional repressor) of toxin-antitoxin stability system